MRFRTAVLQIEEAHSRVLAESEQKQKIEADLQLIAAELETTRREYRTACTSRDALLRSISWRVTAPLRFLSSLLRLRRLKIRREFLSQARLVTESGLFDSAWYSQRYPDVLASGNDPALHYVMYGAAEGRDPGPRFDAGWYVKTYPDIAEAHVNPLIHYLTNGLGEGRQIRPKFFSDRL